ncbi:fibrocystin-L-like [Mizuhopecten yessoensis]|uniref:fibrocystin-L-like n=1 Tax=Mizuhopecten yessoensis TaxID=6573 RepID=UPI000B45CF16|nr:fibrocystin-L-like [Mizuhopecten yessoensis]
MGSDQFGAQVMIHTTDPAKQLTTSRIEYVEFYHVGQAFRIGRYPINFHATGDMLESYVRGCSIHRSFNRAINIVDTQNLLVDSNVIYDINGGAIVLEEGSETGNIIQYNLALLAKSTVKLLVNDITPATFWITNPNNTVRHNTAAGGTHYGYWFNLDSVSGTHYPQMTPFAEFYNNTAHSFGWDGLTIYPKYIPRVMFGINSYSSSPKAVLLEDTFIWNCEKGLVLTDIGAIQVKGLVAVNNVEAGFTGDLIVDGNEYADDGPLIEDSLIAGHVSSLPTLGCTKGGVASPYRYGFTIRNVTFVNFDQPDCAALTVTKTPDRCSGNCGGFLYKTQNLTFLNVENRIKNDWIWESVFEDADGSLCGYKSCKVVSCSGTLPPNCTVFSNSSTISLCVCPSDVTLIRVAVVRFVVDGYNRYPTLFLTNNFGTTVSNYRSKAILPSSGWMSYLVSEEPYFWHLSYPAKMTNVSWDGYFYKMQYGDHVMITQTLRGEPDRFFINNNERNPVNETLDPATHYHGDWQYNETTGNITILVSYRQRGRIIDEGPRDIYVSLQITKCLYRGCIYPTSPPTTTPAPASTLHTNWSSPTSWPNDTLPVTGDNVNITKGIWMKADTVIPTLNLVVIYGVLEFDHGPENGSYRIFTFSARDIIIIGGKLIIGLPADPFLGHIDIILRGQRHNSETRLEHTNIPINAKCLGVYGGLDLHGKGTGITWTRLNRTANPGESEVTLVQNVTWEIGDEIVIAPTSYDIWETETFTINNISDDGFTLSLNDSLRFRHIAHEEMINGKHIIMASEVGLLTRNIRLQGEVNSADMYGGKVIVGTAEANGSIYKGYASLSNVEFHLTGQKEYTHVIHRQFSLLYRNAAKVTENTSSSVTKCVFHDGFSPAIGVYESNDLVLIDNVIHHSSMQAIKSQSFNTTIQRNLIVLVTDSRLTFGAIHGLQGRHMKIKDNVVTGTYGVAFHVPGVECGATAGGVGNEAHSSAIGVAVYPDDDLVQSSCYQISNYFIWKCRDIGIYYNNRLSVVTRNNVLIENTLGLYHSVIGPNAVNHEYATKYCNITHTLIIGATSSFDCTSDRINSTGISTQYRAGHVGMDFTSFMQGTNGAPSSSLVGIKTYPAIMGATNVDGVTFAHFNTVCGIKDIMITTNKANDDGQHPVITKRIIVYQSDNHNFFFIDRPNIEKINPSDCVDMDCDGLKKALIKDQDGSFLGTKGAVISQSEWEWNGDSRRGLGDYKIPREMLTTLEGIRVNVSSIAPHKGIVRNDQCQYRTAWQAYECHDLDYHMLIIESMDPDTETRRLSPVGILGDKYLDLINGPQDHSSCKHMACRKRLSTFMAIVAIGRQYLVHFSSTSPQELRLFLLNSNEDEAVTLGIWYSQSNRRDVYTGDDLVLAQNAKIVNGKYIVNPPSFVGEFVPVSNSTDATGTNYFDRDLNILYVLVRGSNPVKIVTNPSFIVSFQIPALTPEEFYGESLIRNLAAFFDVPPEKIRVVNIVRETTRRKRAASEDITIQIEISDPPATTANATVNETMSTDALMNMSAKFINEVQGGGDMSETLNITLKSIAINEPIPDLSDETPLEVKDSPKNSKGMLRVPKAMKLVIEPVPTHETALFATQPCLRFYDEQDNEIEKLGSIADPWKVTATLSPRRSQPKAHLYGGTTTEIVGGWANFTGLRISHYGTKFSIAFKNTYPVGKKPMTAQSSLFSVAKLTGHKWKATVDVNNKTGTEDVIAGSREVQIDPTTGEGVFDSLGFDQIGIYYLTVHVTSSPEEYDIYGNVKVQMLHNNQFNLLNDSKAIVTNVTMVFKENYSAVVGNSSDQFGEMVVDFLTKKYPDVLFDAVTVTEGSIIVTCVLHGHPITTNTTILSLAEDVASGLNFTFNGFNMQVAEQLLLNGTSMYPTTPIIRQSTLSTDNGQNTPTTDIEQTNSTTDNGLSTTTIRDKDSGVPPSSDGLSHTTLIVIVITPLVFLLAIIFFVIYIKSKRAVNPNPGEFLMKNLAGSFGDGRNNSNKTKEFSFQSSTRMNSTNKSNQLSVTNQQGSLNVKPSNLYSEVGSQPRISFPGSIRSNRTADSNQYLNRLSFSDKDLGSLHYYTGNGRWRSESTEVSNDSLKH